MTFNINSINCNPGNQLFFAKKTLNSSQVQGMFASPVLFDTIPTPSSTQAIVVRNWGFNLTFNTTAYTGGGAVNLYYDTSRTQSSTANLGAVNMQATQSVCPQALGLGTIVPGANSIGKPLYISNATAAFASGDSTVTFYAWYSVVNFDTTFIINSVNGNSNTTTFQVAELYIPSSQVQNLNGTPLTIVSAPGSGLMLIPERMIALLIFNSVAYSASTLDLIYGTSGTQILAGVSNFISGTASQYNSTPIASAYNNFNQSNANNNSLQIKASASPGSSGDSALKIYLSYSTITL